MTKLLQDLRYALRQLRISPVFALVAIASLALGIGANTAIFQLLDTVRLRPLPIPHPEQLAEIRIVGGNEGFGINNGAYGQLTRPVWWEIKEHHEPFSGVFAWSAYDARIGRGSNSRPAKALEASGEFFAVLGIQAWRGRLFGVGDGPDSACKNPGVVVSYSYWRSQMAERELGGNDSLIVDGRPEAVIGVTPPGFFGLSVGDSFDIAVPLCRSNDERAEVFDVTVMGRLRPGWSLQRASAQMGAASGGIFEANAPAGYSSEHIQTFKNFKLGVYGASTGVSLLRDQYDRSLWLLLAITALVLLIACANLANLMLVRASGREREFAVRLAIGASRADLLRQSLVESGLIAVMGTAAGIVLAQGLTRVLIWSLSADNNVIALATGVDWRVLLFAASVAVSTCLIFGVVPALRSVSAQPVTSMKSGGRGMTGARERFSAQRMLVVAQISVSLVLLVGALLFVRSFRGLMNLDTGMREKGITLAFFEFSDLHLPKDGLAEFKRQLLTEVRAVPGILDAATTTHVPLLGGSWEHQIRVDAIEDSSKFTWVSPGYFEVMGIPVLEGRGFAETDTSASTRVAVVNQTFVRQFLGGINPIGHTLRTSPEPQYPSTVYEIVGVIPDTKYNDIRGITPPMVFAPASQFPAQGPWVAMMIYANASPEIAIKRRLAETHPAIVTLFSDFRSDVTDGLKRERLLAMLSGFFGALAALLAMVGLYGVMSYMVARRRNEIGIRVALGANRGQVIAMVMREAARLILIGAAAGTLLSLAAGRGAKVLLFELKPHDPLTLAASVLLLAVVAACASFLPARRAAKVDPMEALRYE
jgi:predicted permease